VIFGGLGIAESKCSSVIHRDEHRRTVGLLGGLEEAERAEDASAAFDQEVAGEAGELAELGYECLVACI